MARKDCPSSSLGGATNTCVEDDLLDIIKVSVVEIMILHKVNKFAAYVYEIICLTNSAFKVLDLGVMVTRKILVLLLWVRVP